MGLLWSYFRNQGSSQTGSPHDWFCLVYTGTAFDDTMAFVQGNLALDQSSAVRTEPRSGCQFKGVWFARIQALGSRVGHVFNANVCSCFLSARSFRMEPLFPQSFDLEARAGGMGDQCSLVRSLGSELSFSVHAYNCDIVLLDAWLGRK